MPIQLLPPSNAISTNAYVEFINLFHFICNTRLASALIQVSSVAPLGSQPAPTSRLPVTQSPSSSTCEAVMSKSRGDVPSPESPTNSYYTQSQPLAALPSRRSLAFRLTAIRQTRSLACALTRHPPHAGAITGGYARPDSSSPLGFGDRLGGSGASVQASNPNRAGAQ